VTWNAGLNYFRPGCAKINSVINPNIKALILESCLKFVNVVFVFVAVADEYIAHGKTHETSSSDVSEL